MTTYIGRTRLTMFHDSTNKVRQSLKILMALMEENMLAKADALCSALKRGRTQMVKLLLEKKANLEAKN